MIEKPNLEPGTIENNVGVLLSTEPLAYDDFEHIDAQNEEHKDNYFDRVISDEGLKVGHLPRNSTEQTSHDIISEDDLSERFLAKDTEPIIPDQTKDEYEGVRLSGLMDIPELKTELQNVDKMSDLILNIETRNYAKEEYENMLAEEPDKISRKAKIIRQFIDEQDLALDLINERMTEVKKNQSVFKRIGRWFGKRR